MVIISTNLVFRTERSSHRHHHYHYRTEGLGSASVCVRGVYGGVRFNWAGIAQSV
jgi:hypothetical protein